MIYDCFSFYNELDLLEIRLNVLKDVVDKFVLAEATHTHTGKPKPLFFKENKERFSAFADKIIHIIVDDFPQPPKDYTLRQASWMRENYQRNQLIRGLKAAKDDDLIIISDVDEIPRPESVFQIKKSGCNGVVAFGMEVFCYYLNYKNYTHYEITTSRIVRKALFKNTRMFEAVSDSENLDKIVNVGATATNVRYIRPDSVARNSGWHFSYLGGAESIVKKIGSIAIEYANEKSSDSRWVAEIVERGEDVTGCGGRYFAVPIDSRLPRYIQENTKRYASLVFSPAAGYYKKTRWDRRRCAIRGWIRKNGAKLIPRPFKNFLYTNVYCRVVKNPIAM